MADSYPQPSDGGAAIDYCALAAEGLGRLLQLPCTLSPSCSVTVTAPTANLLCTVLCDTCRSQPLTDKGKQVLDDIGYGSFLGCALRKSDALLAALKGYLRKRRYRDFGGSSWRYAGSLTFPPDVESTNLPAGHY